MTTKMTLMAFILLAMGFCYAFKPAAQAQTWHPANQVTFAWDAVSPPKDASGNALPGEIKYQAYVKFQTATATPVAVGSEITVPQQTVSFGPEGRYFLCAQALRYPPGETVAFKSALVCSDVAANCADNKAFGVVFYIGPADPKGLRVK